MGYTQLLTKVIRPKLTPGYEVGVIRRTAAICKYRRAHIVLIGHFAAPSRKSLHTSAI